MSSPRTIREVALGPDSHTESLEAQVHVLRLRINDLRAFVEKQIGAFPAGPHSQGSDLMAGRVVAEINAKFRGLF